MNVDKKLRLFRQHFFSRRSHSKLTGKFLRTRKLIAKSIPRGFRKLVPESIAKHLYFSGVISLRRSDTHVCYVWNHSDLENSMYWGGGEISYGREGLTLDLFTTLIENVNLNSFLDGGANSGTFGLICLGSKTTINSVIFAEPFPSALELLHKNLLVNPKLLQQGKRVEVLEGALGKFDGAADLYFDPNKSMQFSATLEESFHLNNSASLKVDCLKMSTFIKRKRIEPPDIVKLDIEGAEYSALLGFEEYLRNIKFLFVEILKDKNAIELSELFDKSSYLFVDIDDARKGLRFIPVLGSSSYRNVLIFQKTYLEQVSMCINQIAGNMIKKKQK